MTDSTSDQSSARGTAYLYMAAAFVVVVAGMRAAAIIVNPLLLAVFLSVVSAPAYFALLRRGISNWLSLGIVIGSSIGMLPKHSHPNTSPSLPTERLNSPLRCRA